MKHSTTQISTWHLTYGLAFILCTPEYFQQVLYPMYVLADGSCWSALQLYRLWSSPVQQMWLCHFTCAKGGLQWCQHAQAALQQIKPYKPDTWERQNRPPVDRLGDVMGRQPCWQAAFESLCTNMAGSTISNFWSSPVSSPYQSHAIWTSSAY